MEHDDTMWLPIYHLALSPVLDASAESSHDSILISWKIPEGSVTGFKVACKHSDTDLTLMKILDATKTKATFTGLNEDSEYALEVCAVNGTVESEAVVLVSKTLETEEKNDKTEEITSEFVQGGDVVVD